MILLDTHAWIWWTSDPERLSRKSRKAIEAERQLGLAAVSCWEFAMLIDKGRIAIDQNPVDWMERSFTERGIELLPLTPVVAVLSTQLGRGFHGDPADRQIVATALTHNAKLVTMDKNIRQFKPVETIW